MNTNNTNKLAGKVALVTGGSRGIGAAVARRLAADGASVAITISTSPAKADDVVREIEAAGGKPMAVKGDAADTESVQRAVAEVIETFGRIDILVNNAGVAAMGPVGQFVHRGTDRLTNESNRIAVSHRAEAAAERGRRRRTLSADRSSDR